MPQGVAKPLGRRVSEKVSHTPSRNAAAKSDPISIREAMIPAASRPGAGTAMIILLRSTRSTIAPTGREKRSLGRVRAVVPEATRPGDGVEVVAKTGSTSL